MLIKDGQQKPLGIEEHGRELHLLLDDFIYVTKQGAVVVPKGFVTDRASIPTILWFWKEGNHNLAAIPHDFLYNYGRIRIVKDSVTYSVPMSKDLADKLFYGMLLEMNRKQHRERTRGFLRFLVGVAEAYAMYLAVKWFGGLDKPGYGNYEMPTGK